jgi:hypothetical protein
MDTINLKDRFLALSFSIRILISTDGCTLAFYFNAKQTD